MGFFLMPLPLGNFVYALVRDEIYTMAASKQNDSLENIPITMKLCIMTTLPTSHTGLLTVPPPPSPQHTKNREAKDLLTGHTWSQG